MSASGQITVSAQAPIRRLRNAARSRSAKRGGMVDFLALAVPAAIGIIVVIGAIRPIVRTFSGTGWAIPGTPGRLFAAASVLLLLGILARVLRSAGPITTSSAFWFWLLSAPVRRRDLLRRRYFALIIIIGAAAYVAASIVAHAGSVPVLPTASAAALAAIALTGGAVCGQAWDSVDRVMHVTGQAARTVGVLAFGSLATGVGPINLSSLMRAPSSAAMILLVVLLISAVFSCFAGYLGLDRIEVGLLRRGQGLWTSGHLAAVSMDVFALTDFLTDQRARQVGRIRPVQIRAGFIRSLARSEGARLRRRAYLALQAIVGGIVWWGCRSVLAKPALAVVAVVIGYSLVLQAAGTLRQLTVSPALRAQFAPRDRLLSAASFATCLLASIVWAGVVVPGLNGGVALTILIALGLPVAVYRTVTRPPLDYTWPLVPTPAGDFPLDLWRQMFRGILFLTGVIVAAVVLASH